MPAAAKMVVQTESPKVVAARRMVIQLLLASGNHNCAVRGSDGRNWTDFQMMVQRADSSQEARVVRAVCINVVKRQIDRDRVAGGNRAHFID